MRSLGETGWSETHVNVHDASPRWSDLCEARFARGRPVRANLKSMSHMSRREAHVGGSGGKRGPAYLTPQPRFPNKRCAMGWARRGAVGDGVDSRSRCTSTVKSILFGNMPRDGAVGSGCNAQRNHSANQPYTTDNNICTQHQPLVCVLWQGAAGAPPRTRGVNSV